MYTARYTRTGSSRCSAPKLIPVVQRVQDYRERRATLENMWTGLARSAWETFVSLAHAQAVADASEDEDFNEALLANEAYGFYIRPVWRPILEVLDRYPVLCTTEETVAMDDEVMTAGVEALMGMWRRLGLTFVATGPGETYIGVDEPERPSAGVSQTNMTRPRDGSSRRRVPDELRRWLAPVSVNPRRARTLLCPPSTYSHIL